MIISQLMKNNKFELTFIITFDHPTSTAPHACLLVLFECEHTSTELLTFMTQLHKSQVLLPLLIQLLILFLENCVTQMLVYVEYFLLELIYYDSHNIVSRSMNLELFHTIYCYVFCE